VSRGQQLAYVDAFARSLAGRVLAVEPADAPTVLLDWTEFKGLINKRIRMDLASA
jgi:hypothetical protein